MVACMTATYIPSDVCAMTLAFRKDIPQIEDANKVINITIDALSHTGVLQAGYSPQRTQYQSFGGYNSYLLRKQDGESSR